MPIHEAIAGLRLLAEQIGDRAPVEGATIREAMLSVPGLLWTRVAMPSGIIESSEGGALRSLDLSPGQIVGASIYDWPRSSVTAAVERAYETARPVVRFVSPGFGGLYLGTYVPGKDQDGHWTVQGHILEVDTIFAAAVEDTDGLALIDADRRELLRRLLSDLLAAL
ncbi:MAG TPA: hypothetical protein VFH61_18010 [Thermoleophilia bacterium]|nr:hypothetical protein [Thermoleophilia bacterium]